MRNLGTQNWEYVEKRLYEMGIVEAEFEDTNTEDRGPTTPASQISRSNA
jgi:hypothetical protein